MALDSDYFDDRIPAWPPDTSAILYGRLNNPDWKVPWHDVQHIVSRFSITPSLEYGVCDPLRDLHELSMLYNTLAEVKGMDSQRRAQNVILQMISQNGGQDVSPNLPLGVAAPLREAARTCQLAPPGNWPLEAYNAIGRNDLAASATRNPDLYSSEGYKTKKEFIVSNLFDFAFLRLTICIFFRVRPPLDLRLVISRLKHARLLVNWKVQQASNCTRKRSRIFDLAWIGAWRK